MAETTTRPNSRRTKLPGWAGFVAAVLLAVPAHGDDGVFAPSVSTPLVPGSTVVVPLYVRDVSGTPLGRDAAAGLKIQDLAVTVTYSPAAAVDAIHVERAGVTAALTPLFETEVSSGNRYSWIVAFDEGTALLPFTVDSTSPGDQVAEIRLTLAVGVSSTTIITLDVVAPTALGNQPGTVAESLANGLLTSQGGDVGLAEIFADRFESGSTGAWSVTFGGL